MICRRHFLFKDFEPAHDLRIRPMDELLAQTIIDSNQDRKFGSNVTEDTLWSEPRISDARIPEYGIQASSQFVLVRLSICIIGQY